MKYTVVCDPTKNWEYICNGCGQLRFYPKETEPTKCGACGSNSIVIGRPGTLNKEMPTMAKQQSASEAVKLLDTRAKGMFDHVQNPSSGGGFDKLPSDEYEMQLSAANLVKNGKGHPQVDFIWIVVEGDFEGKQVRDRHEIAEQGNRTVAMALEIISSRIKNTGYDVSKITQGAKLLETLEKMTEDQPRKKITWEDNNYGGQVKYINESESGGAKKSTTKAAAKTSTKVKTLEEFGAAADEGDDDAQKVLNDRGAKKKLKESEFDTWVEFAAAISEAEGEEIKEGGDEKWLRAQAKEADKGDEDAQTALNERGEPHGLEEGEFATWKEFAEAIIEAEQGGSAELEVGSRVTVSDPDDDSWNGEIKAINGDQIDVAQDDTDDVWTVKSEFVHAEE